MQLKSKQKNGRKIRKKIFFKCHKQNTSKQRSIVAIVIVKHWQTGNNKGDNNDHDYNLTNNNKRRKRRKKKKTVNKILDPSIHPPIPSHPLTNKRKVLFSLVCCMSDNYLMKSLCVSECLCAIEIEILFLFFSTASPSHSCFLLFNFLKAKGTHFISFRIQNIWISFAVVSEENKFQFSVSIAAAIQCICMYVCVCVWRIQWDFFRKVDNEDEEAEAFIVIAVVVVFKCFVASHNESMCRIINERKCWQQQP